MVQVQGAFPHGASAGPMRLRWRDQAALTGGAATGDKASIPLACIRRRRSHGQVQQADRGRGAARHGQCRHRQVIPKQYLKTIKRTGLGAGLFAEMRFRDDGTENPDFVLNKPAYREAKILVAGDNFGCGSSARACALGAARFRHPLRDLDELRRHLLQQLLQERHPADPRHARAARTLDGRRAARGQCDPVDRSRGADYPGA